MAGAAAAAACWVCVRRSRNEPLEVVGTPPRRAARAASECGLSDSSHAASPSPGRPERRQFPRETVAVLNKLRMEAQVAHDQMCKYFSTTQEEVVASALAKQFRRAFWDQLAQQLAADPEGSKDRLRGLLGELRGILGSVAGNAAFQEDVRAALDWEQFEATMSDQLSGAVGRLLDDVAVLVNRVEAPADSAATTARKEELKLLLRDAGVAAAVPKILEFLFTRAEAVAAEVQAFRVQQAAPLLRERADGLARKLVGAELAAGVIDLSATRDWLRSTVHAVGRASADPTVAARTDGSGDRALFTLITEGVFQLIQGPSVVDRCSEGGDFPELLRLDVQNLFHFQNLVQRLGLVGCLLNLITYFVLAESQKNGVPPPPQAALLPLKRELLVLLQHPGVNLPSIQRSVVKGTAAAVAPLEVDEQMAGALCGLVAQAVKTEHAVYKTCEKCVLNSLRAVTTSVAVDQQPLGADAVAQQLSAASMSGLADDVVAAGVQLGKMTRHNVTTFVSMYRSILADAPVPF
eukprot:TRINITY_DN47100_c0_g1_i1.p1 TRINITY_DN47100_c0_g1~~TRINITY_DN47100_c0_g1_i1.p1  ORF type:complete len:552 (+),score=172.53 TRINITY_DN47100_c0_g1_i1:96-1658(+)